MKQRRQLDFYFELPNDPCALLEPGVNPPELTADPLARAEEEQRQKLQRALSIICGVPIQLILNDNSSRMVSGRRTPTGIFILRLHNMFLEADPDVVTALAKFVVTGDKSASAVLDNFIADHRDEIAPPAPRRQTINSRGIYHNLQEIFDEINLHYFQNSIQATITWGKEVRRRRRKKMQMGCYCGSTKMIRIHPALDQAFVPRYYVAWVIYHEMLHAHFGVDSRNAITGRRILHPAKLEYAEKEFEHYELAHRWEEENIGRLMKY